MLSSTITISFKDRNLRRGVRSSGFSTSAPMAAEEVSTQGGELVAADESMVVAKPLLDLIVVENGHGDGCLPNSSGTNEGDWNEVLGETSYLLDQFITSKEGPRWQRREFAGYAKCRCKMPDQLVVEGTDLP